MEYTYLKNKLEKTLSGRLNKTIEGCYNVAKK
jgi:hypothetical protein